MADMQIVPAACNNVEAQYVEMMVPLYSYGCERKVKNTLSHLKGIYSVNVDFYQQKVTVWGICNKYDVLETIKTKRKAARFWNEQDAAATAQSQQQEDDGNRKAPPSSSLISSSFKLVSMRSFKLMKTQSSLKWKTWKNAFIRSNSF